MVRAGKAVSPSLPLPPGELGNYRSAAKPPPDSHLWANTSADFRPPTSRFFFPPSYFEDVNNVFFSSSPFTSLMDEDLVDLLPLPFSLQSRVARLL